MTLRLTFRASNNENFFLLNHRSRTDRRPVFLLPYLYDEAMTPTEMIIASVVVIVIFAVKLWLISKL
jgi:hypothetical protein